MCGIAGAFAYGRSRLDVDEATLGRMTDALAHRGPDGRGLHLDPAARVALGHRRLSIIDLAGGAQPMSNDDGTLFIVYNGEVYNHAALRAGLEAEGVRFRTRCDTEVVLRLYEARGADCLSALQGMFAFAIFDARRGRLFLARDRIGIKPLYTCDAGGTLFFASEPRALFAHPAVPCELDRASLYHHLSFMSVPAPATMYRHVRKLRAGYWLEVDTDGVRDGRYWDALDAPRLPDEALRDEEVVAAEIRRMLREAVRDRMMSDVPFGVFLSGGIDSSANVALMAEYSERPIETFTVGYAGRGVAHLNELHHARRIALQYGTHHHEVIIDHRSVLDYLPGFLEHQDEPVADPTCVPLYYVSKLAVDHGIKVVEVGEGSDELFIGYLPFLQAIAFERNLRLLRALPAGARDGVYRAASPLLRAIGHRALIWEELLRRLVREEVFWGGAIAFGDREKAALMGDAARGLSSWREVAPFYADIVRAWPDADLVAKMTYVELRERLPELMLARVDKVTMSVSLEARVPFLDHRLVEYALRLPGALKLRGGRTKAILKKAVRGLLPDDLIHRRKQGFPAPIANWVFADEFGRYLRETLRTSPLVSEGLVDGGEMARYADEHFSERRDHGNLLWTLFNLSLWYRRWIERRSLP